MKRFNPDGVEEKLTSSSMNQTVRGEGRWREDEEVMLTVMVRGGKRRVWGAPEDSFPPGAASTALCGQGDVTTCFTGECVCVCVCVCVCGGGISQREGQEWKKRRRRGRHWGRELERERGWKGREKGERERERERKGRERDSCAAAGEVEKEREGERKGRGGEKLDSNNLAGTFFPPSSSFLSLRGRSLGEKKEKERRRGSQGGPKQTDRQTHTGLHLHRSTRLPGPVPWIQTRIYWRTNVGAYLWNHQ